MSGGGSRSGLSNKVIEDLLCRFVINKLPEDDRRFETGLMVAIQQAYYFFSDVYSDRSSIGIDKFRREVFEYLRLNVDDQFFSKESLKKISDEHRNYVNSIRRAGAIIVSEDFEKVVIVVNRPVGRTGDKRPSFPKGKIDRNETEEECAIREVREETGLNIRGLISRRRRIVHKNRCFFIVSGYKGTEKLEPEQRNEVLKVSWRNVRDLKPEDFFSIDKDVFKKFLDMCGHRIKSRAGAKGEKKD